MVPNNPVEPSALDDSFASPPLTALRRCLGVRMIDGTILLDFWEHSDTVKVFMWLEDLVGDGDEVVHQRRNDHLRDDAALSASGREDAPSPTILPDGSAFFVASFPLPETHWLYQRDPDGFIGDPPTGTVRDAARWAVKAATDGGRISDFDPDAMVQNFLYALRRVVGDGGAKQPSTTGGNDASGTTNND